MFHCEHGIALHTMQGKLRLISQRGGCLMGFLELQQEPVVYCRVRAGKAI